MSNKKSPIKRRSKKDQDEASDSLLHLNVETDSQSNNNDAVVHKIPTAGEQQLVAPIPMVHTRSHGENHLYSFGCIQFGPSLESSQVQHEQHATNLGDNNEIALEGDVTLGTPAPLYRTLSTPEPYRPLRHRANSAFGNFRSFARNRSIGANANGAFNFVSSGASSGEVSYVGGRLLHQNSDPGMGGTSAFHPVMSKCSVETESTAPTSFEAECTDISEGKEGKKISPPRLMGSKLLSGIRGALKSRRRMSGRENPVSLLAEEEEDEDDQPSGEAINIGMMSEGEFQQPLRTMERASSRVNSSSDVYSDSDLDEDIAEPIVGQYHLLDEEQPRPPEVELPSVEVVPEGLLGTQLNFDRVRVDVLQVRPDSGDVPTVDEMESPAYHPLDEEEEEEKSQHHNDTIGDIAFPELAICKSPKIDSSPNSDGKSSTSPHSRTTASGQSSADYEVRETNRRSSLKNHEQVTVDLDGNATVHSSSTTSSNYHIHSPKIREGAMPGERFASTPASAELNICNLSLSNSKANNRDIIEQLMLSSQQTRTHSPHTVSSASVSNTSSSSSETKKPLKFVAIKNCQLSEDGSPKRTIGTIIKPRISKSETTRRLPPISQTSYQKPPQSPRKEVLRSGARTPTHTPPPRSGAITPSSPPVIVDGPMYKINFAKKPTSVRSGMILHPPSEMFAPQTERELSQGVDKGANTGAEVVTPERVREEQMENEVKNVHNVVVTPDRD